MTQMLKVKHAALQVLPMRTRAVATLAIDYNSLMEYGTELYKIIREGDYHAAGFWMAIGATDTTAYPVTAADYPSGMTLMRGMKEVPVAQAARVRYSGS